MKLKARFLTILSLLMVISIGDIYAQGADKITVRPKRQTAPLGGAAKNKSIQLECVPIGQTRGTFSVSLNFEHMINVSYPTSSKYVVEHFGDIGPLLYPTDDSQSYDVGQMRFQYLRGNYKVPHDDKVVYRLPFDANTQATVKEIEFPINEYMGVDKPEKWNPIYFSLKKGDLIYPARKGVVVEVRDSDSPIPEGQEDEYLKQRNYIIIEHEDGTLAEYYFIERGSTMVKIRDKVDPSMPIAKAGTVDGENYQVTFVLYKAVENDNPSRKIAFVHESIDPRFASKSGQSTLQVEQTYEADDSDRIIIQEMTPKERKKYEKSKK